MEEMPKDIKWSMDPDTKDYEAGTTYMSLLMPRSVAAATVGKFLDVETTQYRANDILRAAQLPLLAQDDPHVAKDLKKIQEDIALAPVLLARDTMMLRLLIVDGYHRVCAVYHHDPNAEVHCKII